MTTKVKLNNVDEVLASMHSRFHPEGCKSFKAAFHWKLSGKEPREFTFVVDHGKLEVLQGPYENPEVTLEASSDDYLRLVNGDLRGITAIMTRKLKVKGSLQLTSKIDNIFS
jgi:putative sterol carrier protein